MKDCNKCKHLNITEKEQLDKRQNHICLKYSKRVFHNTSSRDHSEQLHPYCKCWDDNYKYYESK